MYEIKVKLDFSAAHNLRNYRGRCERLHGHNWIVEAVFSYKSLDKSGMAVDFKIAKGLLREVTRELDHTYLNELKFFNKINPTSENIARFIYESVKRKMKAIKFVTVWENDTSSASYMED
ncbi:MAG: 6-carboxytetrahydropterin synthase QueD [Omnitrophica bacterium RIFCSPLOWO2_01_FULL_45_10]|nr:MAG: 6-carboxytetrahydropterin synthase QueD [Omnitrophica bacterium RIFCSPLOWO2_01_FULL_45_10]